jgi:uncharacterized protein DUF6438
MQCFGIFLLGAAILPASILGQERQKAMSSKDPEQVCITNLSGFPAQASDFKAPPYPSNLGEVTMEYYESGCLGSCPVFKLSITKDSANWEGHAYVHARGKRRRRITEQQFHKFLQAWYDGRFFAMRDDYCSIKCQNGVEAVVLDVRESSITLERPNHKKRVYQCYEAVDGKPLTPRPPDQYFELTQSLQEFAKLQKWLR